ncbi:hypothetical protein H0H92_010234 [Tricholoma furcatifolium]|nr:hypothetical protein H0H92_010234 [Tricholoma furcatifolium]
MGFDFDSLEAPILRILSAPNIDLSTITAKNVRRQLMKEDSSLTQQFLRDNRQDIDAVIARVYETVNSQGDGSTSDVEENTEAPEKSESRKRKQEHVHEETGGEEVDGGVAVAPSKKAKKASKSELSDAELARQLSDELNGRARRTSAKPTKTRGNANGASKRGSKSKKSAETVDSDEDSNDNDDGKVRKKKKTSGGGGGAKGGFAKEFILSEPLAAVLKIDKLSRPQVVKQLWVHIKDNGLQNPDNKREIVCDPGLRAVFGVDKIDMFKMNKVLGQ